MVLNIVDIESERIFAASVMSQFLGDPMHSHPFLLFSHPLTQLILCSFFSSVSKSGKRVSILNSYTK